MRDHTPLFIRGLGTVFLLVASIAAAIVTTRVKEIIDRPPLGHIRFSTEKPFAGLTDEEKKVRPYHVFLNQMSDRIDTVYQDTQKKDFLSRITTDPIIGSVTYIGTLLIAFSFFAESHLKWKKENEVKRAAQAAMGPQI